MVTEFDAHNKTMMEDWENVLAQHPDGLVPRFTTPQANKNIALYRGTAEIQWQQSALVLEDVAVNLEWLPTPGIMYKSIIPEITAPPEGAARLYLKDNKRSLSVYAHFPSMRWNLEASSMTFRGLVTDEHTPPPSIMDKAYFHLVNFHNYPGSGIRQVRPTKGETINTGRLQMASSVWQITVDEVPYDSSLFSDLKQSRGYGITHFGLLERIDRRAFSLVEARETLEAMEFLFALIRGAWAGPVLDIYQYGSDQEWVDFRRRRVSPWTITNNWFPRIPTRNDSYLDTLFTTFLQFWSDELWKDSLRSMIIWYVVANLTNSPETAIVLTSTALELLFWTYFVESASTGMMSKTYANKNLGSWESKLTKVVDRFISDQSIPEHFTELRKYILDRDKQLDNGPGALATLRNAIVHPHISHRNELQTVPTLARIQAQQLGLYYLEKSLLAVLNYQGPIEARDPYTILTGGD